MIFTPKQSQILVVDVQERLFPHLVDHSKMKARIKCLLIAAEHLTIPVTVVEQYPSGLGPTVDGLLQKHHNGPYSKTAFSAMRERNTREQIERLKIGGKDQLVIVGCEAHVCVLQTAIDALTGGYHSILAWDAVSSRSLDDKQLAEARLRQTGCTIASTEMLLFEWMGDKNHPAFAPITDLLK